MARSKIKGAEPAKRWAELSEDVPPQIWGVSSYREHLRQDLRHVRVIVTPVKRKPRKRVTPNPSRRVER